MSSKERSTPTDPVLLNDASEFEEVLSAHDVVLVDFYADWCGPCQMMEPTIERVASETDAAVLKVNVDQFQGLAGQYGVQSIPTVILFASGEAAERMVGMQTAEDLTGVIGEYIQ